MKEKNMEIYKLKKENINLKLEIETIKNRKIFKIISIIDNLKNKFFYYKKRFEYKIIKPLELIIPNPIILKKVNKYIKKHYNQTKIIALPTVDWNLKLYQRPQHLALNLSNSNIFYIYGTYNYKDDNIKGFLEMNKNLIITNQYFYFLGNKNIKYIFLLSTQQGTTISNLKKIIKNKQKIIYDYIDEIHEDIVGSNKQNQFLLKRHDYIMKNKIADLVLCVSKKLYNEAIQFYPKNKVLLSQNGVDYKHFQINKKESKIPNDLKEIVSSGKKIIGYYGAMANWLDFNLLNETAQKNPQWNFVYIGVDYNGGLAKLNQKLPNVHFLGPKDYGILPKYGIWFDITMIPFAKGEIAKSTSPLKMYEYMALKKPIVVTEDLHECYGFEGVLVSKNNVNDFEKNIKKAIEFTKNKKIINKLKEQALKNTWEKRALEIHQKLKSTYE